MKRCSRCEKYKPLEDFNNWKFSKDGRANNCRECCSEIYRNFIRKPGKKEAKKIYRKNKMADDFIKRQNNRVQILDGSYGFNKLTETILDPSKEFTLPVNSFNTSTGKSLPYAIKVK